jgi:hypothetical protein
MRGYSFMDSRRRGWELDGDGLYAFLRAATRARLIRERTRLVEHRSGWLLPTTWYVETRWDGLRTAVTQTADPMFQGVWRDAIASPETVSNQLAMIAAEARRDILTVRDMQERASRDSAQSIDSNVRGWERALSAAQFTRDASATILVVGAGVMSGGTALGVLGAGSVLRGTATYQDTGNVGAALIQTTGTFIVGAIPLGAGGGAAGSAALMSRATPGATAGTIVVIQSGFAGMFQGTQALVQGDSVRSALAQAGTAAGLNFVTAGLGDKIGGMTFASRIVIGSAADYGANQTTNAVGRAMGPAAAPAPTGVPIPRVTGAVDYAGIPLEQGQDARYIAETCLRCIT